MTQEYKNLRELDVQPGDVVKNNAAHIEIIADTSGDNCLMESGLPWGWHNPIWRIVSRAPDTPKPLRDMTDAEIGALVRAKNEGKVIEVVDSLNGAWVPAPAPGWWPRNAYRVRPEPKRETVTLFGKVTDKYWGRDFPVSNDTYRIVFDLIDGRPDCDSIKMEPI